MVLRGLDDVSEIVMRAGAGEWACQPQPAPDLAPASWLLASEDWETGSRGLGIGWMQRTCSTADQSHQLQLKLQCRAAVNCSSQTACSVTAGGGAKAAGGGASQTGPSGTSGTARPGDSHPGTLMVSQRTVLDCFNAETVIAAVKNVPVYWILLTEPSIKWNKKSFRLDFWFMTEIQL